MKQAFTPPMLMDQTKNAPRGSATGKNFLMKTKVPPVGLKNVVRTLLVCALCWLVPSVAKADTPIPTSIVSNYNPATQTLTVTVHWFWTSTADKKHVGAAMFADLNGDGIIPTVFDNPATYTSGGNPFPAGLQARDEFLGQLAISNIEGYATSSMFPGTIDNTDNGIAANVPGITPTTARMLMPYGTRGQDIVNASGSNNGSFTLTYTNVIVAPSQLCVILYDPHSPFQATGGHSVVSAGPDHNTDNSYERGNSSGTVSCTTLSNLQCAANRTEASCQSQAAINAAYTAWLNTAVGSGCNGTLTNNSTGAPSACGGSKTVTWTYTQTSCPNQAQTSTCTATFTVLADNSAPVFTSCPSGANLGCNPSGTIPPAGNATATDNCGNSSVTITNSLGPVIVNGNQRTQTRTYTATDACGNSSTCQQVFTWTNCGLTNPDFNVTYVNVPVPGNVKTNDVVPSGTTYGIPTLSSSPAGSTYSLSMNTNGTYVFQANMPGVYVYEVPVCVPGAVAPCPTTTLTITVLNATANNNPPVANPDIAFTKQGVPVTINTLANDKAGNPGGSLNPGSVTVTVSATNGTTSINPATGNNTYTPNAGFTGLDVLTYQVCDNSVPALCATAKQYIVVSANGAPNTTMASDDYAFTPSNTPVSGNVKTNDTDPEGNTQTVAAQTTTVAAGTLVLSSSGSFTFTPTSGFTGPVSFVYTTCDNGVPSACANATLYILVSPSDEVYNPDFNVTYVNVPVPGNVRTNDLVPPGTNYGVPTLTSSPAGSTQTITMNSNGTYTFVANTPGVYTYDVPVCISGAVPPCPNTLLTITVLNPVVVNNPPVANTDIAVTRMNTPVVINTLANDRAGNPGGSLNPASVTVTIAATNGTSVIDPATGNNIYIPNAGFTGIDMLTYRVCDNSTPTPLCATAKQFILVLANNGGNTTLAADDYAYTTVNTSVSGNVKTNDTDPEGNLQTVTAQTTTVAQGTLVLATNGSFTFTPASGFIGPVSFVYQTCDNGVPSACASATLYILVSPPLAVFNPDFNVTYVNVSVDGNVRTNDVVPPGTTYGTPTTLSSPAGSTFTLTMTSTGTYTFVANTPGVYTYNVPVCVPGQVAPCPNTLLTITVLAPNIANNPPVANTDIAYTSINTPVIINTLANDKAGNPGGSLNPASVTVTVAAQHGTSSINPANGNNTYTPNAGFTGYDTLTYQVCDNSIPPLCATAKQIIFVQGANVVNTTMAADDYAYTPINTAVSGNVKTNDWDPEGHTQTVLVQNTFIPGKGTLVLAANGSYTFTPVTGFTGPVSFVYTTCDNGVPSACANATLYVLVSPLNTPDFTPSHDIDALTFTAQTMQRDMVINISEVLNGYSTGQVVVRVRKISAFTITYDINDASVNVFGGTAVNNSDWIFTEDANFITLTLKPGVVIPAFGVSKIGVTITRNAGVPVNTTQNITTTIVTGSGGDTNSANNQVVTSITAN